MNIEPGVFLDDLPNYSMIVGGMAGDMMSDVRIFSKGKHDSQTSIYSQTGTLSTLSDAFVLTLHDGEIHELESEDHTNYRRIIFDTHKILIPADNILLNRRDSSNRTDREMTIPMIIKKVSNYENKMNVKSRLRSSFSRVLGDSILPKSIKDGSSVISAARDSIKNDTSLSKGVIYKRERQLRDLDRQMKNELSLISSYSRGYNKYLVEAHKKFSLPVACILFVLLGAPLGVMAKKGGFAVSTSLSFGFFLDLLYITYWR